MKTAANPYSAFYFSARAIDGTGNYYWRGARILDTGGAILWIKNGLLNLGQTARLVQPRVTMHAIRASSRAE